MQLPCACEVMQHTCHTPFGWIASQPFLMCALLLQVQSTWLASSIRPVLDLLLTPLHISGMSTVKSCVVAFLCCKLACYVWSLCRCHNETLACNNMWCMQVLVSKLDVDLWHKGCDCAAFLDTDQHCFTPQKLSHCIDPAISHAVCCCIRT